jgi:DNA-binding transcriptional regulator YhcF (GntR family)
MRNYKDFANIVQAEIESGRLRPGDQLPTQRDFAFTHGIAMSTSTRVFSELARRGLIIGEAGRGTFVRTGPPTAGFALARDA